MTLVKILSNVILDFQYSTYAVFYSAE